MTMDAAKLAVTVVAETGPAEKGLQSFSGKMTSLAGSMGRVGAGMSLAITAPLVGIATSALTMAADFEKSMNVLEEVTGAPAAAIEALQAQALQLGKDTIFSANEAAEAMLELGKAGMTTAEIGDSIEGVMNLAAAGEMSLADAANITTGALNAFGLAASESTRISDIYAAAANASTASMTDLAQGGRQAGFAFHAAGMPIEDMATSLALLTNNGLTGSDAGTALKNMLVQLMSPTKKATKIMDSLGISVFDLNGNMLSMPDIIQEFETGMAGLTEKQRLYNLENILGSDGMKAMIPLMDAHVSGYNDMKAAVTEQGVAARIAEALTKGLGGAMEYLSGSVATFLTGAALPFLDMIGGWVRGVADMITGIGNLPGPVLAAAGAFLAVLAAAGPIVAVIAGVAGAFALLGGAVAGPIFLIVGALAALAAAFAGDFLGIRGAVQPAIDAIGELWTQISNIATTGVGEIKLGGLEILWTPNVKTLNVNDVIQGIWTPKYTKIQVDDAFVGEFTPDFKHVKLDKSFEVVVTPDVTMVDVEDVFTGTWTPDYTKISVFDLITGIWTPSYSQINIGDIITGTFTPTSAKIQIGDLIASGQWIPNYTRIAVGDLIEGIWQPNYSTIKVGDLIEGIFTPSFSQISVGDFITGVWTPDVAMVNIGDIFTGTFDLKAHMTKISIGDFLDISGSVGADGKIKIMLTGDDFDFDLTAAIADMNTQVSAFNAAVDALPANISANVTAINASVDTFVAGIDAGVTAFNTSVDNFDPAAAFAGMVDSISASIKAANFKSAGAAVGTAISEGFTADFWQLPAKQITEMGTTIGVAAVAAGAAVDTARDTVGTSLASASTTLGAALTTGADAMAAGVTAFNTTVQTAVDSWDWTAAQTSLAKLHDAIMEGLGEFAAGFGEGFKTPAWITTLTTWSTSTPNWLGALGLWSTTAPEWLTMPQWVTDLIKWQPLEPAWVTKLIELLGGGAEKTSSNLAAPDVQTADILRGVEISANATIVETTIAPGLAPLPLIGEIGKVITPNAIPLPPLDIEVTPIILPPPPMDPLPVEITPTVAPMGPLPKMEVEVTPIWGTMAEMAARFADPLIQALDAVKGRFGLQSMIPPGDMAPAAAETAAPFEWPAYPPFEWPKLPEFPKFSWPALTKFEWPALPEWMWPDMPKFDWPALPTWTWPALPIFDWPEYPRWTWPSIPQPGWIWPEIPMPGWVSLLLGGPSTSTGAAPATAAAGGAMSTKGAYLVGESGPEIVLPSRGSRILTNGESMALAGAGGVTVVVQATINTPLDLEELGYKLAQIIKRRGG